MNENYVPTTLHGFLSNMTPDGKIMCINNNGIKQVDINDTLGYHRVYGNERILSKENNECVLNSPPKPKSSYENNVYLSELFKDSVYPTPTEVLSFLEEYNFESINIKKLDKELNKYYTDQIKRLSTWDHINNVPLSTICHTMVHRVGKCVLYHTSCRDIPGFTKYFTIHNNNQYKLTNRHSIVYSRNNSLIEQLNMHNAEVEHRKQFHAKYGPIRTKHTTRTTKRKTPYSRPIKGGKRKTRRHRR